MELPGLIGSNRRLQVRRLRRGSWFLLTLFIENLELHMAIYGFNIPVKSRPGSRLFIESFKFTSDAEDIFATRDLFSALPRLNLPFLKL